MNEHIEYFKRWSACYLEWSHSNMDRIVKDAIKRQERIKAEEDATKERLKYKPIIEKYKPIIDMFKATNLFNNYANKFFKSAPDIKVGDTLKIKLPSYETIKEPEPSFFDRVYLTLSSLLKGTFP